MMDTRLAMMGIPIDFTGSMTNGLNAGILQRQAQQQNALATLYQAQGPQIMAGDPQALNALAQFDPSAAMGIQSNQLGMQQARQSMGYDAEKMQMVRDSAKRATADAAANMTAAQAKAESDKMGNILQGAMAAPDEAAYNAFLTQQGIDPATHPFATRDMSAAMVMGAKEVLDIRAKQAEANAGPDWRAATQQEAGAYGAPGGQINGKTGEFKPINPPSGPQTVINNMVPGDPSLQTPSQSNTAIAGDTIWKAAKAARDAANMTSLGATGIPGAVLGAIDPTSSAAEVKRQISVLQANASLSALTAMREASKNGASGLGALTEGESAMLKAKAGALDPNAGSDRFKVQLDDYERTLFRTVYGQKNGDFIFEKTRDGTSPLDVVIPTNAGVASGKADYSAMNEDQLLAIDPKTLSFADRAQYIDRLDAIMAGMK